MNLVRLTDDVWVNPAQVGSIYIDQPSDKTGHYPVMMTAGCRYVCLCICDSKEDAELYVSTVIDLLNGGAE